MNFNFLYKKNIYVCVIDYMIVSYPKMDSFSITEKSL